MKNLHENNKIEQNSKNTTKLKIVVFSLLFLVVLLGISYALFSEILIGEKHYQLTSGGLKIYLDETKTSQSIGIQNAIPVSDDVGLENDPYNFSLVNEEIEDLAYTIYLVEDEIENLTPSSAIRYNYTRDVDDLDITRNIEEQQTEDGRFYLESGVIPSGNTYNYTFRMWINYEAGNEIMGTSYSIHLVIDATQTTTLYAEAILNGTDPVLTNNLVPVVIADDGTVTKASAYKEWYKYEEQRWANAVVLADTSIKYKVGETIPEDNIESYFVWIPRYKYKIFNLGNYTSITSLDATAVQTIEVEFETKDIAVSTATAVGDWHSHPAFQAFDSNGFWVGKFESGYNGATSTSTAQVNVAEPDKLIIKPNVYSWRNITVGNAFKTVYDYLRKDESYMMKNTEWGAVAYLQHSAYGSKQSLRVNNNTSYRTGYAAVVEPTLGYNAGTSISGNLVGTATSITLPYNTTVGYNASTTGNITGVYDMSGGAHEYVMGYNEKASSVGGSSGLTSIYGDFFTSETYKKYYDKYQSTSETVYSNRILGDATGEMGPFGNVTDPDAYSRHRTSWYGDYGNFATASNSWFHRGGDWKFGVESGMFLFRASAGNVGTDTSFRVVLTPKEVSE